MKKMILLGFLIMQGNNVECMLRQVVPVLKKGAQELGEGAYNWYTRGKHFSTQKQVEERGVYRLKSPQGYNHGLMLKMPGELNHSRSFVQEAFYGGINNTMVLDFKRIIKGKGDYWGDGDEDNVRYKLLDINPAKKDLLYKRFAEEIKKKEIKLLNNSIKEINAEEIFDMLLNEPEFKELNMQKLLKRNLSLVRNDGQYFYGKKIVKRM